MLSTNLATRPFYNERLVRVVLAGALLVAAAWAAASVVAVLRLNQQGSALAERVRNEGLAAGEANQLIARRTFSWTTLFTRLEATLPLDVRLSQVQPQTDRNGRLMVALTVHSRGIEDLDAFIDRLEATGAFSGVLSRADVTLEDGSIESSVQGYYAPAANPAPAASEPSGAPVPPRDAEGNR